MLFSIVVPVFRVEKYLEACLNSIKNQSFTDYECIMVDDGSDDGSGVICDRFAAQDSRFVVIHRENAGVNSARKLACSVVRGDYIVCVDSDDFISQDLLETLHAIICQHDVDTVCYGGYNYKDKVLSSFSSPVSSGLYEGEALRRITDSFLYDPQMKGINDGRIFSYLWLKCMKRGLFCQCQSGVDDRIYSGEDTLLTLLWCEQVSSVYFSDFCGYYYRVNANSAERTFHDDAMDNLDFLISEMRRLSPEREQVICAFYAFRSLKYCLLASQQRSFCTYKRFVRTTFTPPRMQMIRKAKLGTPTRNSALKLFLLKNKMWSILYILANTWFKGKMS